VSVSVLSSSSSFSSVRSAEPGTGSAIVVIPPGTYSQLIILHIHNSFSCKLMNGTNKLECHCTKLENFARDKHYLIEPICKL
jgi:hypothetical protein